MAKFRVETQLSIDKASAAAGKAAMEGITKAAMQISGALLGGKVFLAPFKALIGLTEESIAASDKASASQDRMRQAMKNVYATIGDQMTPGMNILGASIQRALANPEVEDGLRTTGQLLSVMAGGIAEVVDEISGFVGSPGFSAWLKFATGIDLDTGAMQAVREHADLVDKITAAVSTWQKGVAKQAEEEKRAAEIRKRAHEEHLKDLRAILERLDPVAKAEREYGDSVKVLNQALKAGEISVSKYIDVIGTLTAGLRATQDAAILTAQAIEKIDVPERFANLPMTAEPVSNPNTQGGSMTISQGMSDEQWSRMLSDLSEVSASLGQIDPKMGHIADSAIRMADAIRKVNTAAKGSEEAFSGWVGALTAGVALLRDSGLLGEAGGGTGAMGGKMSGNYMNEGATVGAIIGAIVGAMTPVGPAVGAAIGSALGEVFGSMIKKGADEGLATIQFLGTAAGKRLEVGLTGVNNKLGRVLLNAGEDLIGDFEDIVASLGGQIKGIPAIDFKIRDDVVTVFVNGLRQQFKDMGQAVSFAITEMLKTSEIANMDELFAAALHGTSSSSLEQLKTDLEAIAKIINFGLSPSQQTVQAFEAELDVLRSTLVRTVDDTEQLARGLANLGAEEARRWQSSRDAITGDKKTNAEKLQMLQADAAMWNAEKALRIAELQSKRADLVTQASMEKVRRLIDHGSLDAEQQFLKIRGDLLDGEIQQMVGFATAAGAVVTASMTLIDIQIAAIDTLIAALQNMPDIDIPSLHLNNPGGHGGGNVNTGPSPEEVAAQHLQDVNDFLTQQADLQRSLIRGLGGRFAELNHWYEEQIARATELGIPLQQINDLYAQQFANLQVEALESLGLQSVQTNQQMSELAETLKYLREWGAITDEQLRELGDTAYLSLVDGLLQYVDNEEVRAQLEDLRFRMEIANYKAQFAWLQQLGLLTQAEIDVINGLFTDIQDAYEHGALAFQNPNIPDHQTNDSSGGTRNDNDSALRAAIDRLTNIAKNINQWVKNLALSSASPLTTSQQFAEAQRQYFEMLAAAQGGDLDAMEGITAAAQTYLDLAAQQFGTSGAGYQAMFDLVRDQVAAIGAMAQQVIDGLPPQMQGTEDRLDTIAEIMRAIAIGLLGSGAGGIGAGGSTGGNGLPPGWNPNAPGGGTGTIGSGPGYIPGPNDPGMGHYRSGSLGSTGNLTLGNFSSANGRAVIVRAPELEAKVLELANAQAEVAREAKKDRNKKAASGLAGFYGAPIGSSRAS